MNSVTLNKRKKTTGPFKQMSSDPYWIDNKTSEEKLGDLSRKTWIELDWGDYWMPC